MCHRHTADLLPNPHSSSGFSVKLSARLLVRKQMPCAKPWNNDTDSGSGSRVHLHTLAALRCSGASREFGGRTEVCQLSPSRGSPAPVHGSGPPDQLDKTPSRTACSSEKTKTTYKLNSDSNLRQAYLQYSWRSRADVKYRLWFGGGLKYVTKYVWITCRPIMYKSITQTRIGRNVNPRNPPQNKRQRSCRNW